VVRQVSQARQLARKLGWAALVIWAVVSLTFVINNVLPSDPARMVAGPHARPADVARIREQLGLSRPLVVQYGAFLSRLVHFGPRSPSGDAAKDRAHATCGHLGFVHVDLGKSYQQRRPVLDILAERLPRTLMLALAAILVQGILGVSTGVLAARFQGRALDRLFIAGSLVGVSAPTFILGLGLQYVLARRLRLLPIDGFGHTAAEHLWGLCLPALTLGIYGAAYYTRLVRDDMVGVLQQDFIRTARAKGATEARVLVHHALRNALLPVVTMLGMDLGALVGGAVVTETLFRWPGIGALSVTALLDRDGPVIMGTVLVTSTAIVLANVAVDLLYGVLDARTRR
jgi:peptide/nickel transport system permease protein